MQESIYYTDLRWPELKTLSNQLRNVPILNSLEMSHAEDEPVKPHSSYVGNDLITRHNAKVFWSTWGHTSSKTGTYGCPTKASASKGKKIMDATVHEYLELLREMRNTQ